MASVHRASQLLFSIELITLPNCPYLAQLVTTTHRPVLINLYY